MLAQIEIRRKIAREHVLWFIFIAIFLYSIFHSLWFGVCVCVGFLLSSCSL